MAQMEEISMRIKIMKETYMNYLIPSEKITKIMGILEGEESEKGTEGLFKQRVDKNFPGL